MLGCSADSEQAPHVLVVTLDTTRADALGVYGGDPAVTPRLDQLAQRSTVFTQARTVAPITLPSHSSMFTGLYPPRHGVRDNGPTPLPSSALTLAEGAKQAGYQTAAFVSSQALDRSFGLNQGFDLYDQPSNTGRESNTTKHERADAATVARALDWLQSRQDNQPVFLWVHLFDPHAPYEPSPDFLEQAKGDAYLGEVASMDAAFGQLLDAFESHGTGRERVIAVVGDHGEGLNEHGEPTHAFLCFDSTLRVPMLWHDSRASNANQRVDQLVSVVDLFPSLARTVGMPLSDDLDGQELFSLADSKRKGLYFESFYGHQAFGWSPLVGWIDEHGKYIHSSSPQYFAWSKDPDEERDLTETMDADFRDYVSPIARVLELPALPTSNESPVPDEVLQGLQALGYVNSGEQTVDLPDPLAPLSLPAPQHHMEQAIAFNEASELIAHGRADEAVSILEELLESNPKSLWAMDQLANAFMKLGRHEEALVLLRARLEDFPDSVRTHQRVAECLKATGGDQALVHKHLRRAMWLMAEASEARGDTQQAESYRQLLRRALDQDEAGSD